MKLPIGQSDFRGIIEGGFEFVDKSLFIRDILDDTQVILITRPRRFGKTLNLSMLQYFFAQKVLGVSTTGLFDNLLIAKSGDQYWQHQGKYPVIFFTLKDVKGMNFKQAYEMLYELIVELYDKFHYLLESNHLSEQRKKFCKIILDREANPSQMQTALKILISCLAEHHGVKPLVLIDEYDTPIQHGYVNGFYREIMDFVRSFLGLALKDNSSLFKAVLTGILRVSKESLFSDLNNLEIYSLLRSEYGAYFGFTEKEVSDLLIKANLQDQSESIRDWYNGYQMGGTIIYNPWSIINCLKQKGELQPYWVNTSDNVLIKDLIIHSSTAFKSEIESLLQGKSVEVLIDERMVFHYLKSDESAIWNLFLMAGYLKVLERKATEQGILCILAIPNREIRSLYRRLVETWLSDGRQLNWYNQFLTELVNGNVSKMQRYLNEILINIVSMHDISKQPEVFYHGLMLGLTASLHNEYEVKSNRESGYGFYDIMMIPKDLTKLGIVIELKIAHEKEELEKVAQLGVKQISDRHYIAELTTRGISRILKMGIAFCGKQLEVAYESEE